MKDLSRSADSDKIISAERSSSLSTSAALVCLNFKVPLRIRQQFKIHAAQHNMTMTELLLLLLNDCLTSDIRGQSSEMTTQPIKK